MRHDYPVGTLITCVLVGGDGHGKSLVRSPADAWDFRVVKQPPLVGRIFKESEDAIPEIPEHDITIYGPFAELSTRSGFIRLFRPEGNFARHDKTSMLQIADALRIAGIDSL